MSLTNTMKSLSESERPYEKCERLGASHLTDTELLAVLLRTGSHGENALELSRRIYIMPEKTDYLAFTVSVKNA